MLPWRLPTEADGKTGQVLKSRSKVGERLERVNPADSARHLHQLKHLAIHRRPVEIEAHRRVPKVLTYKKKVTGPASDIENA
jgi:hypothetical protein